MSAADHSHGHDSGHGHGHGSPFIQHHYDDAQHQFDSGKLGIWIFLAQEVLFFSALFVAYILYRSHHPEIYAYAHKYLDVKYGAINTGVLIFSSLTAAWAVRAAQLGQKKLLVGTIAVTILCAFGFLGIKYIEYSHKVHEQILFGENFDPCLSSGGAPLLTKSNTCPGHQNSVWFEANNAETGCMAASAIDLDADQPGVQADCEVTEDTREPVRDKDGNIVRDEFRQATFKSTASTPVPKQCAKRTMHGSHAESGTCWEASPQPAVCRPGFFFTVQVGDRVTKTLRANNAEDCEGTRSKYAKQAQEKATGETVASACVRGDAVGFIVDHNDHGYHGERNRLAVVKSCRAPAPKAGPADVFGDVPNQPKLGEKAIAPTQTLTKEQEHEALYLGPPPPNTNMFFTIYFAMTGLHGIHVLVGIFVFIWLLIRAMKGHFTPDYFGPIDFAALYWHIVDLIWIFLFPLLYLIH